MNSFFQYLTSKTFWINLFAIVLFVGLSFVGIYKWLEQYTHHGTSITVPDLRGMTKEELNKNLANKDLRYAIVDSSVFDWSKPKGTVIEQEPAPNSQVKKNRTIYLTVTKTIPPQVKLPNLIDVSYRQAEAILRTYGLKVGEVIYKPDLAKNAVLAMMMGEEILKPGDEVSKGSTIDLVLGDGFGNRKIKIPNLVGLAYDEAIFVLKGSALNVGEIKAEKAIKDSSSAVVYRQYPAPSDGSINQGEYIDLYLAPEK